MYDEYFKAVVTQSDELEHFGVVGMKWGVRRYQNKDGSLTAAGKKRYSSAEEARKDIVDKANAKLEKLDQKAKEKSEKFDRRYEKNRIRIAKADTSSYFNVPYRWYAGVTSASVARTGSRAQRKERLAHKWAQKMEKVLGKEELQKTKLGQKYLNMTITDITKSNVKIDELYKYLDRYNRRYQYLNFGGGGGGISINYTRF